VVDTSGDAWDPTGRSLHTLALLHHELMTRRGQPRRSSSAEMRQHEDRHGLTPKAMLQLRWRVGSRLPSPRPATVLSLVPDPARPDPAAVPSKRALKAAWVDWAVAVGC
jgi:hypothetical protein